MSSSALAEAAQWVISNGYLLMFVAMLIEGPAITAAGAFAAALGHFNLWIVFLLSILASTILDIIFYTIGFLGQKRFIKTHGHRFGITVDHSMYVENLLAKNLGEAVIFLKVVPFIAIPGFIIAGASKVNFRKYILWSSAVTALLSLSFILVGYYFGAIYGTIVQYIHYGGYLAAAVVVIFILVSRFYKEFSKKLIGKFYV